MGSFTGVRRLQVKSLRTGAVSDHAVELRHMCSDHPHKAA
jgi:hypothetical protein